MNVACEGEKKKKKKSDKTKPAFVHNAPKMFVELAATWVLKVDALASVELVLEVRAWMRHLRTPRLVHWNRNLGKGQPLAVVDRETLFVAPQSRLVAYTRS